MCASWNKKMRTVSMEYLYFIVEVWIWKYKIWDFVSPSPATPTPRPYPDYSKLRDSHYLPSTKTPTSGRKPDDYQPRAQIKQLFREGKLKARDKKTVKEFSEKYIVSEKLVANYIEHLSDIEMIKDKRLTDNNRKRTERKQQEYKDIDWDDLYHRNQMSSLRVGELELYINWGWGWWRHIFAVRFWLLLCRTVRTTFSQPLTQIQSLTVAG